MGPMFFESRNEFRDWLAENHDTTDELWVGYFKKGAEETGISYGESVEEAICFGWIDGLVNGIDDETYKRRFTPRKPDSKWSKKNKERVEAMMDAGKMTRAGLEAVEAGRESGEWEAAYRVGEDHDVPAELETALQGTETAWENFQDYSNTDQHVFIRLVNEAKTDETKRERIEKAVELAEEGLSPYDEDRKRRL